jgi:hypothetical protein
MEKFVTIVGPIFAGLLFLFMTICAHTTAGIFNNMYSRGCKAFCKPAHRILGWVGYGVAAYEFYEAWLGMKAGDAAPIIIGAAGIAFAWFAWHGFKVELAPEDQ